MSTQMCRGVDLMQTRHAGTRYAVSLGSRRTTCCAILAPSLRYVCVCIHVYVCMYACMHACMYVCMHVCMYVCMHACMYVCMHVCMYACMHVCMYVCMHVCIRHTCYAILASNPRSHPLPLFLPHSPLPSYASYACPLSERTHTWGKEDA